MDFHSESCLRKWWRHPYEQHRKKLDWQAAWFNPKLVYNRSARWDRITSHQLTGHHITLQRRRVSLSSVDESYSLLKWLAESKQFFFTSAENVDCRYYRIHIFSLRLFSPSFLFLFYSNSLTSINSFFLYTSFVYFNCSSSSPPPECGLQFFYSVANTIIEEEGPARFVKLIGWRMAPKVWTWGMETKFNLELLFL